MNENEIYEATFNVVSQGRLFDFLVVSQVKYAGGQTSVVSL
jgi:hypothetical protein